MHNSPNIYGLPSPNSTSPLPPPSTHTHISTMMCKASGMDEEELKSSTPQHILTPVSAYLYLEACKKDHSFIYLGEEKGSRVLRRQTNAHLLRLYKQGCIMCVYIYVCVHINFQCMMKPGHGWPTLVTLKANGMCNPNPGHISEENYN